MQKGQMDTIRTIVDAMKVLDQAKADAKDLIDAAFAEYQNSGGEMEKKAIMEVCKAVQKLEMKKAIRFHQAVTDALVSIGQ